MKQAASATTCRPASGRSQATTPTREAGKVAQTGVPLESPSPQKSLTPFPQRGQRNVKDRRPTDHLHGINKDAPSFRCPYHSTSLLMGISLESKASQAGLNLNSPSALCNGIQLQQPGTTCSQPPG